MYLPVISYRPSSLYFPVHVRPHPQFLIAILALRRRATNPGGKECGKGVGESNITLLCFVLSTPGPFRFF